MAEQTLVQFRVDKGLKNSASEICEELGIELTTVLRMCMKQIEIAKGIPFSTKLPENTVTREQAKKAFHELRKQAADLPEMSLDEINAEIAAVRAERRARKAASL